MTISWVDVDANVLNTHGDGASHKSMLVELRVSGADHLWCFFIGAANELQWRKSTDGGATWGSANSIDAVQTWTNFDIWFDRWTPDDTTGNTIHIIATNTDLDLSTYFTLGVDDDLAEANNDVDIVASPGALNSTASPTICKAIDGDIYVGWLVSATAVGAHFYRSADSGATWGSIYGRTEWDIDTDSATDIIQLIPLKTDDDILCVFVDDSGNDIYSIRYDGTATDATGWDASVVEVESNQIQQGTPGAFKYYNCAVDDNGDVHLVWFTQTPFSTPSNIIYNSYDESASTWGTEVKIFNPLSSTGVDLLETGSVDICYDKIDGTLFVAVIMGATQSNVDKWLTQSYDGGVTWGQLVNLGAGSLGVDDWREFSLPKALLHTDNKLCMVSFNDDANDIESLSGGIVLLRKSGTVVDDLGVAVTTADCNFFRKQTTSHQETIAKYVFLGKVVSDGSGNWVVPLVDHHNDTPDFQVLYDDDLASDETDASRRFST